jgi:hypothetical protein
MLLPLSFILTSSIEDLQHLNKRMFWIHILFVSSILIFSVLGIGEDQYGGGSSFKTGTFTHEKIYIGSFLLILSPLIFRELKNKLIKNVYVLICLVTVVILLLSVRRTSIVIVLIGAVVYLYYYKDQISRIFFYLTIVITILVVSMPLYQEILIKQLQARSKEFLSDRSMVEVLQGEMRYFETIAVWKERLFNPDKKLMLFGEHLFDSKGRYANGILRNRNIHLDINIVLHGSGIIGLLLFLGYYVQLIYKYSVYRRGVNFDDNKPLIYAFNGLFISNIFLLFSGGMTVITFNMISALYMGAILGYFRSLVVSHYYNEGSMIYSNDQSSFSVKDYYRRAFLFPPKN